MLKEFYPSFGNNLFFFFPNKLQKTFLNKEFIPKKISWVKSQVFLRTKKPNPLLMRSLKKLYIVSFVGGFSQFRSVIL